jgi:hypothetical protein
MTNCNPNENGYNIGYSELGPDANQKKYDLPSNPIDTQTNVVISFNDKFSNVPFNINSGGTNMVVYDNTFNSRTTTTTATTANFIHIAMQPHNNMIMNFNIKAVGDTRSRKISYMVCDFYIIPYYHKITNDPTKHPKTDNLGLLNYNNTNIFEDPTNQNGEFITKYVINDTLLGSQYPRHVYTCNYIAVSTGDPTPIDKILGNIGLTTPLMIKNPFQPTTSDADASSFISSKIVQNIPQVIILNQLVYATTRISGLLIAMPGSITFSENPNLIPYNYCLNGTSYDELKGIYIPKTEALITSGTVIIENPVSYTDVADGEIYIQCNPTPDEKGDNVYSEIVGSAALTDLSRSNMMNYFSTFMIVLMTTLACFLGSEFLFTKLIFEIINPGFIPIKHPIKDNQIKDPNNYLGQNKVGAASIILIFNTILWGTVLMLDAIKNESTTEYTIGWAIIVIVFMMCFIILKKQSIDTTKIYEPKDNTPNILSMLYNIALIFNYVYMHIIYTQLILETQKINYDKMFFIFLILAISFTALVLLFTIYSSVKYHPIFVLLAVEFPAFCLYLYALYNPVNTVPDNLQ